eukprot:evm.model.scf_146.4 EVM.evm.TU.scf_146.4   scf_146:113064-113900(-)
MLPKLSSCPVQPTHSSQAAPLRHLLTVSAGNITIQSAEAILRGYGIDTFGPIVYMAKTPTCPLDPLPASARAQLFTFCQTNAAVRKCRKKERRDRGSLGLRPPLFHMACRNQTCLETLTVGATSCVLRRTLDLPATQTVNTSCRLTLPDTMDSSQPFTPVFLQPVGERSVFDCILGLPVGSNLSNRLSCNGGFFRAESRFHLGGEAFLPPEADFRCTWDGRCREDKGCCAGDALFEGEFICYLPEGAVAPSMGSGAGRQLLRVAALLACLLAILLALS